MRYLHQTVLTPDREVVTVPGMYASLADRGVGLRSGEISLIAGPPGAGKSTLALALAVRSGIPTLYFSADSTENTQRVRLLAMLLDIEQSDAEAAMKADREWASQVLSQASHIAWDTRSNPSLEHIELTIEAFREAQGEDPGFIIIDNAGDVAFDSGDEFGSLRTLMRELRWFARDTAAAVCVLHHTREGEGNPAPPQSSLHGKIAQVPALVLTVTSTAEPGFMGVAPVKNRYGRACPAGNDPVWLRYDPANMQLEDLEEPPHVSPI